MGDSKIRTYSPINERGRVFRFIVGDRNTFDRRTVFEELCREARQELPPGVVFELRERIPPEHDEQTNIVEIAWYSAEYHPEGYQMTPYEGRPLKMGPGRGIYILLAAFVA